MTRKPSIDRDFINYNKKVGPGQLIEVGYPGSGKSNHASGVITKCIKRPKEMVLMHGDLNCEWRHYLNFTSYHKGIILLIPDKETMEIYYDFPKKHGFTWETRHIDYVDFNIVDHLEPGKITVVYDDFLVEESKTWLWAQIAEKLVMRRKYNDHTITYLCHEAHEIYPQNAESEQWKAIQHFCRYFAHFRKRNIRTLLLAHSETELFDRVRKKCYWRIYRDAFPTHATHRKIVKKYVFKMAVHKYHLFKGELYVPLQENKKMKEISGIWLMLPRALIKLKGGAPQKGGGGHEKKPLFGKRTCRKCEYTWEPTVENPKRCPGCSKRLQNGGKPANNNDFPTKPP